ncbi:MAG TPA: antibiotic biosynthesis monooxygenase [Mycobacteriales bacterium]|nr:antibiotic biosynthesis monooxygenase [Mycobacteriales bacterium]
MLVLTRFSVSEADGGQFADQAADALDAFARCTGYLRGSLGREVDDPTSWLLLTEWDGVGAYRRALSGYDVKVRAVPLLARGQQEPGAYEVLQTVDRGGTALSAPSDRAVDAGTAGPGTSPASAPEAGRTPPAHSRGARGPVPLRPDGRIEQETP